MVKTVAREIMEAEVSELIGAELGERRPDDRATHRNGYRPRRWDTRAGEIELQIPKLRQGSYFPSFLQPRKRSEQALVSVVQQAYVCGVSTRRVDRLVESLGLRISKSEVSRIAGLLDEQVQAFRQRPLGRCWRIPDRRRGTQQKVVRPNGRQPQRESARRRWRSLHLTSDITDERQIETASLKAAARTSASGASVVAPSELRDYPDGKRPIPT